MPETLAAVARVPESAPLVIRAHRWRYAAVAGATALVLPGAFSVPFTALLLFAHDPSPGFWVLAVAPLAAAVVATVEATVRAVRAGPTFAADTTGVWIGPMVRLRRRATIAPPLFVPWESVARIAPGRRAITVKARPEQVNWLGSEASRLLFRTGVSVAASYEFGVSPDELLARLKELAAGRAPIG